MKQYIRIKKGKWKERKKERKEGRKEGRKEERKKRRKKALHQQPILQSEPDGVKGCCKLKWHGPDLTTFAGIEQRFARTEHYADVFARPCCHDFAWPHLQYLCLSRALVWSTNCILSAGLPRAALNTKMHDWSPQFRIVNR